MVMDLLCCLWFTSTLSYHIPFFQECIKIAHPKVIEDYKCHELALRQMSGLYPYSRCTDVMSIDLTLYQRIINQSNGISSQTCHVHQVAASVVHSTGFVQPVICYCRPCYIKNYAIWKRQDPHQEINIKSAIQSTQQTDTALE